jgi:hypothetical protein
MGGLGRKIGAQLFVVVLHILVLCFSAGHTQGVLKVSYSVNKSKSNYTLELSPSVVGPTHYLGRFFLSFLGVKLEIH